MDGGNIDDTKQKGRGALLVGEEEGGLAMEELEPEVVKALGAWCDTRGS